jgi:hypothetical protein
MPKGTICPEFPIQQPGQVPIAVTSKSLTIWSQEMDHQKPKRIVYRVGIRNIWSFGLAETQKFCSLQLLFCQEQIPAA